MGIQLIHAMNDLTATHKDLLGLSKRKTEALTNNKLDEFRALLLEEQKLIRQLEKQEQQRQEAAEAWNQEQPRCRSITDHYRDFGQAGWRRTENGSRCSGCTNGYNDRAKKTGAIK